MEDWVIADDPTTPGEIEARQVLDTFVRQTDTLVDLYVDGEIISTTGEHPFWTSDKGWVEASYLQVGSLLKRRMVGLLMLMKLRSVKVSLKSITLRLRASILILFPL